MFYVQMYNVHKHNIVYMFVNINRLMIQTHTYLYYTFYLTVQHIVWLFHNFIKIKN